MNWRDKHKNEHASIRKMSLMKTAPGGAEYYWKANWYKISSGKVFRHSCNEWILSTIDCRTLDNGSRMCDGFRV